MLGYITYERAGERISVVFRHSFLRGTTAAAVYVGEINSKISGRIDVEMKEMTPSALKRAKGAVERLFIKLEYQLKGKFH